jgi:hypothetical protein
LAAKLPALGSAASARRPETEWNAYEGDYDDPVQGLRIHVQHQPTKLVIDLKGSSFPSSDAVPDPDFGGDTFDWLFRSSPEAAPAVVPLTFYPKGSDPSGYFVTRSFLGVRAAR